MTDICILFWYCFWKHFSNIKHVEGPDKYQIKLFPSLLLQKILLELKGDQRKSTWKHKKKFRAELVIPIENTGKIIFKISSIHKEFTPRLYNTRK